MGRIAGVLCTKQSTFIPMKAEVSLMDTFILVLELIGTVAFAASGAMTGLRKGMDIFGVVILGLTTAVGGGILRDVLLGITPPNAFRNPLYALVAILTAIICFIPALQRFFVRNRSYYDRCMLIMDTIGLGIFTVMGICIAQETASDFNVFFLAFVGVITGVGGGVLRDTLAGDTPYIFVRHVYACASLAGALLCILLWRPLGNTWAMLLGMTAILLVRFLAAHFRWNLPKAHPELY